ncbi:MAG: hypothetical protein GX275_11390 [Clostridiales bacterium]|nr:hypothetical protein [Clostridiales bacterium]
MFFSRGIEYYSKNLERNINELNNGNINVIPWIFCVFAESSKQHKLIAAKALNEVLKELDFFSICKIDREMRQTTSMEWSIDWRRLKVENFLTNKMSNYEKRAVIIFSSFNPNGYIREKAVKLLLNFQNTLPYITLRKNDWVLQVRQAAHLAFCKRIEEAEDMELLRTLPFLEKLRRSSGDAYVELSEIIYKKMSSPLGQEVIKKGSKSNEIYTRKMCFNILFEMKLPINPWVIEHLKRERDPFLRKMIFIKLVEGKTDISEISRQFLNDKYGAIRVMALQYIYDNRKEIVLQEAKRMLLDKNPYVRELARKIIKELCPSINIYKFYIDNLSTNTQCAILGLGEIGSIEDCSIIEPYLYIDNVSIVRASMITLMRLNSEKYKTTITEMLLSVNKSILKTATVLIEKYSVENFERIFEIYERTNYENNKIKCVKLLFRASKWQRLIYMLITIKSEYDSVKLLSIKGIDSWIMSFNSSFTRPTNKERLTIIKLINEEKSILDVRVKNQLLFLSR